MAIRIGNTGSCLDLLFHGKKFHKHLSDLNIAILLKTHIYETRGFSYYNAVVWEKIPFPLAPESSFW